MATTLQESLSARYARAVGAAATDSVVMRSAAIEELITRDPCLPPNASLYDCFAQGLRLRPTAPCMGTRFRADGTVGAYTWQTYEEVSARIDAMAAALWKHDLVPKGRGGHRFLGMYCKNSRDWMVAAEACYRTGVVVVPMYDTLGAETVAYIQGQTQMATVFCSQDELPKLSERCPFAHVIVSGFVSDANGARARSAALPLVRMGALEEAGRTERALLERLPKPGSNDLAMLCYTSGTTGDPKGAMLLHGNIVSVTSANMDLRTGAGLIDPDPSLPQQWHLSYLPLAHIFETVVLQGCLMCAAAVGFYQGDTLKILDDLTALRPTLFVSVPRLYNRIVDKVSGGARAKGGLSRMLFERGLATKLAALRSRGTVTDPFWDRLIFNKVRASLGLDRCKAMVSGSAPISADVKDFMRVVMQVDFIEGYGMTESAAAGTLCHRLDLSNGHVGAPSGSMDVKLQDVAEMGYLARARPPRGEVCLRGPSVFAGYFMMEEKTKETIDADGWLHTGDIGEWTADGQLRIIDRKKNIFKLAQGEYVAAEKIETVAARCPLVAQIFVYGDSLQSWLVAAVVPDAEETAKWAAALSLPTSAAELVASRAYCERLEAAVLEQMAGAFREARFAGFEFVRRITLDAEPWTPENGLLTPTFKLKRNDAKRKYQQAIDDMYAAGPAPAASSAQPKSKL